MSTEGEKSRSFLYLIPVQETGMCASVVWKVSKMAKLIAKKKEEEGKLKCVRCGFNKAECLEYTPEGLMCQNCIYLRLSGKERDSRNLSDLIGAMEEDEDVGETYEGTVSPIKGFTVLLTSEDVLMPEVA